MEWREGNPSKLKERWYRINVQVVVVVFPRTCMKIHHGYDKEMSRNDIKLINVFYFFP